VHSFGSIEDSVILPDVVVNRNVKLRRVVVDKSCVLPEGLSVGFNEEEDRKRFLVSERGVTLITPEMLGQEVFHQR
jgi:glucose-1-phosphate adenylyltransferase